MILFLYFACALFSLTVIAAAICHFKGKSGQGLKKDHRVTTRSQVCPPFGLRDKLMARILETRLDE